MRQIVSIILFLLLILLVTLGIFFIGLSYSERARIVVAEFFLLQAHTLFFIGMGAIFSSLLLALGWILTSRFRVLRFKMSSSIVDIQDSVIKGVIDCYFGKYFSQLPIKTEVICKKEIEILINISLAVDKIPIDFLPRSEKEIGAILYRTIGYKKPFFITLSCL